MIALSGVAVAVDTVRVEVAAGAPRIVVDGRPVRARMFFGSPGVGPLAVGPAEREVSFDFVAAEDAPASGTLHFRFGQAPGDVSLDDIRVTDLDSGKDVAGPYQFEAGQEDITKTWHIWPPPQQQNTVGSVAVKAGVGREGSGGLHVALRAPADGHWPDFHIYHHANLTIAKGHRYRVSFWAKAQPARQLAVAMYRPGQPFVFLGGPDNGFAAQIKMAAAAGAPFVSFPVELPWPKPAAKINWQEVDAACQRVLDINPDALLLPRIGMDPPEWWLEAHPDAAMVWDIPVPHGHAAVVASPEYRREAAERLGELVTHLEERFAPRMAGYHPCGQHTGEWFYPETWGQALNGYAKADEQAWRRWLRGRYPTNEALQAAWGDAKATRDSASAPSAAARRAAPAGILRNPISERPLTDFAQFQQEMMADCVCELARAVRQASRGRRLVVFFYGYGFEFGPIQTGPAKSGHYAMRQVLACPDIDVLCSPISYFDRGLGQSAPAMSAAESVALAGKMWLYEDDTHTHLATQDFPGWHEHVDTLAKAQQELLRNTGQCAVRNFATWWMDLGATGWFNDPGLWEEMKRLDAIDAAMLQQPRAFRPEVAAVIDERSMLHVAAGGNAVTGPLVYESRRPLGRLGAPYGQYLLDDVIDGRVKARVYAFLNAWCMDRAQRQKLLAATSGSLRLWCYAPGFHDGQSTSLEAMRELTGFRFRRISKVQAWAEPTEVGRKRGLTEGLGIRRPVEPLFAVDDAAPDEILATYRDGSAAVVWRSAAGGDNLFVGPPALSSPLLRLAARQARVHLFVETDCNVYANGPYIVLCGASDGTVALDVGQAGDVRDLLTGQVVGQGPKITLPMKMGSTRVLLVEPRRP